MKNAKTRRQLTLLTLCLALGVAVYLNWEYSRTDKIGVQSANASASNLTVEPVSMVEDGVSTESQNILPDKNYGDAQLVSAGESDSEKYFEQARLSRSKARDEALDKLQKALKTAKLTDEEKENTSKQLTSAVNAMTKEADIENLIKAKGFFDCVAFIDAEKVNIAVKTGSGALEKSQVAQIRDIVLSKLETSAKNITVVEVK